MNKIIIGTGSHLPKWEVTNEALEGIVKGFDPSRAGKSLSDWITKTYGIISRHWISDEETTASMATEACRNALENAELSARDIDLIVLSTVTPQHRAPPNAAIVQADLGTNAVAIDIQVACPGFVYALNVADALMDMNGYKTVLVGSSEAMSLIINKERFFDSGLFGDGAGAAVVIQSNDATYGTKAYYLGTNGRDGNALLAPNVGYMLPDNKRVYTFAVSTSEETVRRLCRETCLNIEDIDVIIPHQAAMNIINEATAKLGIEPSRVIKHLKTTGNTSSASIPIALDYINRIGQLKDGDNVILVGMGAGLAWGGALMTWRACR